MKHKDSVVLSYLHKTGKQLQDELAAKHEDGEFLPEITHGNPHLHKIKDKLLVSYQDLVVDLYFVYRVYALDRKTGKSRFKDWLRRLERHRSLEHKLHFDSCFVDIGGDH